LRKKIETAIETASMRLIEEAARSPSPPPLAKTQNPAQAA